MFKKMHILLAAAFAMFIFAGTSNAKTDPIEDALTKISKKIAVNADIDKNAKLAFMDFTESETQQRLKLSYTIEDDLSVSLIQEMPGRFIIKNNAYQTLGQLNITRETLFNTCENITNFGKAAAADYIISGTYRFDKDNVIINVNVINTSTGIILFSERVKINKTIISKTLLPDFKN